MKITEKEKKRHTSGHMCGSTIDDRMKEKIQKMKWVANLSHVQMFYSELMSNKSGEDLQIMMQGEHHLEQEWRAFATLSWLQRTLNVWWEVANGTLGVIATQQSQTLSSGLC